VIDRSKTRDTPKMPVAAQGRRLVRDSGRGNHLGQRSCANATKGRTYERKRSDQNPTQNFLRAGGRPHMNASDLIKILPKTSCEQGAVEVDPVFGTRG
jgi:hypothetical protein